MQVVYAQQPLPSSFHGSLYLAGPTPRDRSVPSWRLDALAILTRLGYDGTVFVPEDTEWGLREDTFVPQVDWELAAMHRSDQIVFWIPRDLTVIEGVQADASAADALRMPAFTTNIEFGFWLRDRERVVLGAPDDAAKNRYIETLADPTRYNIPVHRTLEAALGAAVKRLGAGAFRTGGECGIPLHIWTTDQFQGWYRQRRVLGEHLADTRVEWVHAIGNGSRRTLLWAIDVTIRYESTGSERRALAVARFDSREHLFTVDQYDKPVTRA